MPKGSAINDILQMRQQGLSNNQIIQNLQRQGYSNTQIFDAMNQADTKMAVEGQNPGVMRSAPDQQQQQMFTQPPAEIQSQDVQSNAPPPAQPMDYDNYAYADYPDEKIEELVETIIEEKWEDLVKDVNKIIEWKNRMESRITELETKIDHVKSDVSELNKAIVSKVNEYDKHILEVGSDLKAMEKVFSKVLPTFTENINELSKITSNLKKEEQS